MNTKIKNVSLDIPSSLVSDLDTPNHDMHDQRSELVPDILSRFPFSREMPSFHPALNMFHGNQVPGQRPLTLFDDKYADVARRKAILRDVEKKVSQRLADEANTQLEYSNHQENMSLSMQGLKYNAALKRSLNMVHNRRALTKNTNTPLQDRPPKKIAGISMGTPNTIPVDQRQLAFAGGMASYSPGIVAQIKNIDMAKINFTFPEGSQNIKNVLGINAYSSAAVINVKKVS